ncbi:MAG: hypothetical protein ABL907_07820 [Hyphomicrobium sp.]
MFDKIIDEFSESEQSAGLMANQTSRSHFVWLDLSRSAEPGAHSTRSDAYRTEAAETENPMPSIDPASIANELGLNADLNIEAVAKIRRDFAQRNHPDCVGPDLRDVATIRMQTANALLDAFVSRPRNL